MSLRRATRADVASGAGVSPATVSFVLNNVRTDKVSAATRARVLAVAAELRYVPSATARALRHGRTRVVLALFPNFHTTEPTAEFLAILSRRLADADLTCMVLWVSGGGEQLRSLLETVSPAVIVSVADMPRDQLDAAADVGVPVLFGEPGSPGSDRSADLQRLIGRLQVDHLAERGYRRPAYANEATGLQSYFSDLRITGVRERCRELGLPPPLVLPVACDQDGGAAFVGQLLAEPDRPDCVCAYNDLIALAVLAGARTRSVVVPSELAVIGVDDLTPVALLEQGLSTVAYLPHVSVEAWVQTICAAIDLPLPAGSGAGRGAAESEVTVIARATT